MKELWNTASGLDGGGRGGVAEKVAWVSRSNAGGLCSGGTAEEDTEKVY
ncbi:MAG: hypothetical protein WCF74_15265 [Candidatus Sulfotelmatobacter sp.]